MSIDIYFEKRFTLEDVENKTSIEVVFANDDWWLRKNGMVAAVDSCFYTEEGLEKMKKEGWSIIQEDGETYAVKEDKKHRLAVDVGKKNRVVRITTYGANAISEMLNELILTFQTRVMDDEEMHAYWISKCDPFKLYDDYTKNAGYIIEDGVIKSSGSIHFRG